MVFEFGAEIEQALNRGHLQRVPADQELARRLSEEAESHVDSARFLLARDAAGSFQIAYSAMRKLCTSLLIAQGLRPTTSRGHTVVFEIVQAQFNGSSGISNFKDLNRFRRMRNLSEYPSETTAPLVADDAALCLEHCEALVVDVAKIHKQLAF